MTAPAFYVCSDGGLIALDRIESVLPAHKNDHGVYLHKMRVRYGDNVSTIELFEHEYDTLCQRPVQLIPAAPGNSVLYGFLDDDPAIDPAKISRAPLTAWALCIDGEIRAVTPNGVNDGHLKDGQVWVEHPDGSISGVSEWSDPCAATDIADLIKQTAALRSRAAADANRP